MTNREKYDRVFIECLSVDAGQLNDQLVYQSVPAWDSVGHMSLIAGLEDAFGFMMEMDDVIDFSGYDKGIVTLAKYGITI